jgi:hypothetical protein
MVWEEYRDVDVRAGVAPCTQEAEKAPTFVQGPSEELKLILISTEKRQYSLRSYASTLH